MDKIICIFERGFRKISLPNGEVINVTCCDDGYYISTDNFYEDVEKINRYVGFPVYRVFLDDNRIFKGDILKECKIVKHNYYGHKQEFIYWNTGSINGDDRVIEVE